MDVIGHQHIGMDAATGLGSVFGQPVKVVPVVLVGEKTRLAVITALNQVKGNARQGKTRGAA